MQKRKNIFFALCFSFIVLCCDTVLYATSASPAKKISSKNLLPKNFSDYFLLLDDDYDLACQIPIAENYSYVKFTMENNGLYDSRVDTFLKHCDTLYAAVWLNAQRSGDKIPETANGEKSTVVRCVLTGKFNSLIVSILNKKLNRYGISFYYFSRKVVLITNYNLKSFYEGAVLSVLDALKNNEDGWTSPINSSFYESALVHFDLRDIVLKIDDVSKITNFLGFDYITFGIKRCSAHIFDKNEYTSSSDRNYSTELYLELSDERISRAAIFLFSNIFKDASISLEKGIIVKISDIRNEQSYISSLIPLFVIK